MLGDDTGLPCTPQEHAGHSSPDPAVSITEDGYVPGLALMKKAHHTKFEPLENQTVTLTMGSTPAKRKAFINVDLGEAYGNYVCGPDEDLIPMIDHANVACGFQ